MPPTSKTILMHGGRKRKIMMFLRKKILMMFLKKTILMMFLKKKILMMFLKKKLSMMFFKKKINISRNIWVHDKRIKLFCFLLLCRVCCRKDPSHLLQVLSWTWKITMLSRIGKGNRTLIMGNENNRSSCSSKQCGMKCIYGQIHGNDKEEEKKPLKNNQHTYSRFNNNSCKHDTYMIYRWMYCTKSWMN